MRTATAATLSAPCSEQQGACREYKPRHSDCIEKRGIEADRVYLKQCQSGQRNVDNEYVDGDVRAVRHAIESAQSHAGPRQANSMTILSMLASSPNAAQLG
jgi:hypothetical protein